MSEKPYDPELEAKKYVLDEEIRRGELKLKERQYNDSLRFANRLWGAIAAILPLVAALVAACFGYVQFLDNARENREQAERTALENRKLAERTATLNADTERFKAILNAKKDYFARQDRVFEAVLENTSALCNEVSDYEHGAHRKAGLRRVRQYTKLLGQFRRFYTADGAAVENDDICHAMTLFWNGLSYAEESDSPGSGYQERQALYDAVNDDYRGFYKPFRTIEPTVPDRLSTIPSEMLWRLQVQIAYRVGDTLTRRQNQSEYSQALLKLDEDQ